ncbi:hypothetical protein G6F42_020319 [Rhizopus arrhizus]|nr:hypothetical protein G6F42_020319 [Rhizopus arrhizus]
MLAMYEIKEKKSTITHCEATCQQLQGIINEKESQQRELEMNYEQNRKDELNKMRAQEYLRRDKMIDKHRSTIKKIQDLTMSTLAELKKKMDKVSNERDYWKQKLKEEEEKMKRLQMKERRFAGIWKTKEFDLLREINMLRSEREEFIKMFQTLQASLIAKNVDLDK